MHNSKLQSPLHSCAGQRPARSERLVAALLLFAAGMSACGKEEPPPPPPPPPETMLPVDYSDPCAPMGPTPSNVFVDAAGLNERANCKLADDPIDEAIAKVTIQEGAAIDAEIQIPVDGTLDATSVISNATIDLAATSTTGSGELPPVIYLSGISTSSSSDDWSLVSFSASFDTLIRINADEDLTPGTFHVAVTTSAILDLESPQKPINASPITAMLTGETEITAGGDLDAATAERLERERLRLQPVLQLLKGASPPVAAADITSIVSFTTQGAPDEKLAALVEDYRAAIMAGRYEYTVSTEGDIPPAEIYPGLPPTAYENILAFRRGTISAPQLLDENNHIRRDWTTVQQEIQIPFLMSIPRNAMTYGVVMFLPGFGRGSADARGIANAFSGGPRAAVMAIDLRCHGARARGADGVCTENRDQDAIDALVDDVPNNNNPELQNSDGIPDNSGIGFFPADAQALRDSQMAAIIELIHIQAALREETPFTTEGLNIDRGQIHLVAHGHTAPVAVAASAFMQVQPRTLQLPNGGAGFSNLVIDGPADLKAAFVADLPEGITEARLPEYLGRLDASVLKPLDIGLTGPLIADRYRQGSDLNKILLQHPARARYITDEARMELSDAIGLPGNRVSRHPSGCDDFFIFTCTLGDNPAWGETARQQMVTFADSNGVTVVAPAQ